MKQQNARLNSLVVASITAAATFVLLSVLAGGLMEFSREAGFWVWLRDLLAYNLTNKIGQKLVASLTLGGFAYFACQMVAYGRAVSAKKRARATRVHFEGKNDSGVGRTA